MAGSWAQASGSSFGSQEGRPQGLAAVQTGGPASAQHVAFSFFTPALCVIVGLLAPLLLLRHFRNRGGGAGLAPLAHLKDVAGRPLGGVLLLCLVLGPFFLMVNWTWSSSVYLLALNAEFWDLVALAGEILLAGEKKGPLWFWLLVLLGQFLNALNLLGVPPAGYGALLPKGDGLLPALFQVAPTGCENLPQNPAARPYEDDYCDNGWLTFLIVLGWPYIALHVVVLLLTMLRAVDVGSGGPGAAAGPSAGPGLLANDI